MRILSVGSLSGHSNTCLHRNWALSKVADVVDEVNTTKNPCSIWWRIAYHLWLYGLPVPIPENDDENRRICKLVDENKYDVVWIDKGISISPQTLRHIKSVQPNCKIVSYSPDNMALRHNQSKQYVECVPLYDAHITTKSYILDSLKALGGKNVIFSPQSFEGSFHYPRVLSDEERVKLGGDVGFVGAWEKERYESLLYLAHNGINVRVFGAGKWLDYKDKVPGNMVIEDTGLYNEDYPKSFQAFKISMCFLRKMNYDQQTSRTMEIPACGGFMMAERTHEHQMLFEEGKEAEFFSTNEELLEKCKYYLSHEDERKAIAGAGTKRCKDSDYSNVGMVRRILNLVINE